jgi:hypothetical protein
MWKPKVTGRQWVDDHQPAAKTEQIKKGTDGPALHLRPVKYHILFHSYVPKLKYKKFLGDCLATRVSLLKAI